MRRIWSRLLTAALMLMLLSGCQGTQEAARYEPTDLNTIAQAGAFSETLEELDGDMAFALYRLADYGLERDALTDCAVLRSAGATCEEGAVLVFQTVEQAQQAEEALAAYVQSQIEANLDYRPAEIPKLEEALLDRRENTLLLLVSHDLEAAQGALE